VEYVQLAVLFWILEYGGCTNDGDNVVLFILDYILNYIENIFFYSASVS